MIPMTEDYLVAGLLDEVPEMWPRWVSLNEALDEDIGVTLVLEELAELVTPLLAATSEHDDLLGRAFRAVEVIAMDCDEGATAVAYGFLDTLAPEVLPTAVSWLGPCTEAILQSLEDGTFDPDSELADG
jgi:hypothetical protein